MARQADPNLALRLYEAALDVFAERGLVAARVEDITERAGVSKGAFYLAFASKEALFVRIADDFHSAMLAEIADIHRCHGSPADLAGDCEAGMAAADLRFVAFLRQHRRAIAIVLDCARAAPTAARFERFLQTWMDHFDATVRRSHEVMPAGITRLSPAFVARLATGMIYMLARDAAAGTLQLEVAAEITTMRWMLVAGSMGALPGPGVPAPWSSPVPQAPTRKEEQG